MATALVACKACGREISRDAVACPQCGAKPPKRTSLVTILVAVGLVIIVGRWITSPSPESTQPKATAADHARIAAEVQAQTEKVKADRLANFESNRSTILAKMKALVASAKWADATRLGTEYHDVPDAEFQKLRGTAETKLAEAVAAKAKAEAKKQGVSIGMTQEQVLGSSWGKPEHVNKTTTAAGTREQWVYGGRNYLYFQNGILTSIQN